MGEEKQICKFVLNGDTPSGLESLPNYELRGAGKIYRMLQHPEGWGGLPDYEIR